jgi:hypothetical protein
MSDLKTSMISGYIRQKWHMHGHEREPLWMPVLAGIKVNSFAFGGPLPDLSTRHLTQTM